MRRICTAQRSIDQEESARGYCGEVLGRHLMIRPVAAWVVIDAVGTRRPTSFSGTRFHETIVGEITS